MDRRVVRIVVPLVSKYQKHPPKTVRPLGASNKLGLATGPLLVFLLVTGG